jgi:hypothetical protein
MNARRSAPRHALPVVRWLQVGAVAAGVGAAALAVPGVAAADEGTSAASASATTHSAPRAGDRSPDRRAAGSPRPASAAARSTAPNSPRAAAGAVRRSKPAATAATGGEKRDLTPQLDGVLPAAGSTTPVLTAAVTQSAPTAQVGPLGQLSAFLGLPGAPATSAPTIGAFSIRTRLILEDLVTGTGPAVVTNPTAVVTGLFNEVLRADPTATELQDYLGILKRAGVNGVVAGLYSSTAFRQAEVNNYYLELLNRPASSRELAFNTSALVWGMSEPLFAASIAGSPAFYQASSAGGGTAGVAPSAPTYVANLYRSLLGTAVDPAIAAAYVQQLNAGQPITRTALQFVNADAFRQAKVQEIYAVLGQTATQAEITSAVQNWVRDGGLTGIATSLLATASNVSRIETGQVKLPDMVAAQQLQQILLAAYTSDEDGFVKTLNRLLNVDEQNPCPSSPSCNVALYTLLTTGGPSRGLANSALTITYGSANVADMVPTQNEIDLAKTLKNTLQDPTSIETFFNGGVITPFGGLPVITAGVGTYIVDGHHRWSAIYLINPYAQVTTVDVGYVPSPQTALKETQIGIVAQLGYLKVSPGGGINVYTVDRDVFNTSVAQWITTGDQKDAVLAVFRQNLGIPDTATEAEQINAIENYIWTNVERMRALNPYVPDATNREVMPQASPLTPILGLMGSGLLSYSFPTISYLG